MKTLSGRWPILALAVCGGMGLALIGLLVSGGVAQQDGLVYLGSASESDPFPMAADEQLLTASQEEFNRSINNLEDSNIETANCYQENTTQTLCFTVSNGSSDGEWIKRILLTFPKLDGAWSTACNGSLEDAKDSVGYSVDFNCSTPTVHEILYQDATGGLPGISPGASWRTCVDVSVPAAYDGERAIPWVIEGDNGGIDNGTILIEQCSPLRLTPSQITIEGCNGISQAIEFRLENYSAGNNTDVTVSYDAPGAAFNGPTDLLISEGDVLTFTAQLEPDIFLQPGDQITAEITVNGNGHSDKSTVVQTISENAGWGREKDSPVASMDNVVVWAAQQDGGLWSVGGVNSGGVAQRYDPASDTWDTYPNPLAAVIGYPVDGCYGLNNQGEEIVVLFPDTQVKDQVQVFNITTKQWSTRPIPGFFAPGYIGHWGLDVVSLLNNPSVQTGITDRNMCYLSGGNHQNPGGGTTRNLWRYDPETNDGEYIGDFKGTEWFDFHASWYVPWIGDDGGICVAGGVDHNSKVNNTTQCYDIGAKTFNAPNADLGTLPEPWWGMADGWQVTEDGYEIWIANGVAQNGTLLQASAYFREGMSNFAYGPDVPDSLYRLEGDGYNGEFFTLNGARGGFSSTEFNLHLGQCPACIRIFLPLTQK